VWDGLIAPCQGITTSLLYEIFKMLTLGWAFQSLGEEGVILEQTNFPGHLRQYFEMDL